MKPLITLLTVFVAALIAWRIMDGYWILGTPGNLAMSAMLILTASGHFAFSKGMALMLPDLVPYKTAVVYITGFLEILAAIGLLVGSVRLITAWVLILFFILILPANISAARRRVDYQKATFDGAGPDYLWFRVPLQAFFIAWVYFFGIYLP